MPHAVRLAQRPPLLALLLACPACGLLRRHEGLLRGDPFNSREDLEFFFKYEDCRPSERPLRQQQDPRGELEHMHVVYASNAQQLPGVLLSMTSLARHLRSPAQCTVHLIVDKSDMQQAAGLVQCFSRTMLLTGALPAVELHEAMPIRFDLEPIKEHQTWRPELLNNFTFVRYYLHEYLPEAPRALWLDADTIVQADLGPLYRMHMERPVAMSEEMGQRRKPGQNFKKYLGAEKNGTEYNTGVAVFDLQRWRAENLTADCEQWTLAVNASSGDQVALNLALYGNVDPIEDWRWNVRGFNVMRLPWRCVDSAKILHWSGRPATTRKPWQVGADPAKRFRWRYELVEPYVLQPACDPGA